jgi:hypothetical protein
MGGGRKGQDTILRICPNDLLPSARLVLFNFPEDPQIPTTRGDSEKTSFL